MNHFNFYSPTEFVFGRDRENEAGSLVKKYGGSRVLLHFGGGSVIRSGLLDREKKSLEASGVYYVELGGVKPNPRDTLAYEGIDICRKEQLDFILAVGGVLPLTLPRPLPPACPMKATSGISIAARHA